MRMCVCISMCHNFANLGQTEWEVKSNIQLSPLIKEKNSKEAATLQGGALGEPK